MNLKQKIQHLTDKYEFLIEKDLQTEIMLSLFRDGNEAIKLAKYILSNLDKNSSLLRLIEGFEAFRDIA